MTFRIPNALRQVTQLISGNLIARALGIGVIMLYARIMTKEEIAVFPIFQMLSGLAMIPFGFGIYPTLLKRLPHLFRNDPERARSMLLSAAMVVISGTMVATVIVVTFRHEIARKILGDELPQLIALMSVGFVPAAVSKLAHRVLWTQSRFGHIASLEVIVATVRPCFTLPLYLAYGVTGLMFGLVCTGFVHAAISLFFVRDVLAGGMPSIYPLKKLLRESLPFYLEGYLMYFRRQGDNWFVSTMLGPADLAVYYMAKRIYQIFLMTFHSVDSVVVQRFAQLCADSSRLSTIVNTTHDVISLTITPCVFLTISLLPLLIRALFGEAYEAATLPAAILLIAALMHFLWMPAGRALFVALPSSFRFRMTLIDAICLCVGMVILVPSYGIAGLALARVVAQIGGGLFALGVLHWVMNIRLRFSGVILTLISSATATAAVSTLNMRVDTLSHGILLAGAQTTLWISAFCALSYVINRASMVQFLHLFRRFYA